MKTTIILLMFLFTVPVHSQTSKATDIESQIKNLQSEKISLQKRIEQIDEIIETKKKEHINAVISESPHDGYLAMTMLNTDLKEQPQSSARSICRVPEWTTIHILEIQPGYIKANYDGEIGYISSSLLSLNDEGEPYFTRDEFEKRYSKLTQSKNKVIETSNSIESSSTRCQAITQAGSQCKRNAKTGSNYCWQHQNTDIKISPSTSSSRTIYTGPRGGQYYYNSKGKKTYVRKK